MHTCHQSFHNFSTLFIVDEFSLLVYTGMRIKEPYYRNSRAQRTVSTSFEVIMSKRLLTIWKGDSKAKIQETIAMGTDATKIHYEYMERSVDMWYLKTLIIPNYPKTNHRPLPRLHLLMDKKLLSCLHNSQEIKRHAYEPLFFVWRFGSCWGFTVVQWYLLLGL